jgi:hypothetical protein
VLATAKYVAPSSASAATALDLVERYSTVIPDTMLMQDLSKGDNAGLNSLKAATVSSAVLLGILRNPLSEYEVSPRPGEGAAHPVCTRKNTRRKETVAVVRLLAVPNTDGSSPLVLLFYLLSTVFCLVLNRASGST